MDIVLDGPEPQSFVALTLTVPVINCGNTMLAAVSSGLEFCVITAPFTFVDQI